jgi:hypothetical protein
MTLEPTIRNYLAILRQGQDEDTEAAIHLGLLLEPREIKESAGDFSGQGLSASDREEAIEGLLHYLQEVTAPNAAAVWALAKSYDSRTVAIFIKLLDQFLIAQSSDEMQECVAYQALIGIINIGVADPAWKEPAVAAVHRAARLEQSELGDAAQDYLFIYGEANRAKP